MDTIRRRETFRALRRPSGRARRGSVQAVFVPAVAGARPQVAYSVSRRCGNAVARNRIRRRLRAAVAQTESTLPLGSYLLTVGPEAHDLPFGELIAAVGGAMAASAERAAAGAAR